jgi:hypothetical protein
MKITVTFDSMDEMLRYMDMRGQVQTTFTDFTPEEIKRINDERESKQPDPEPAEAEPEKLPDEPEKAPEEVKTEITEDFRVEVRKTLAALNKLQAGNPAKALIAETGYKRLTDVPLELLPGLMQKAEEAMNHV